MKNILFDKYRKYLLVLTVIFTLSFVFAGKITVEERGKEVFTGEKYKTVFLQNSTESIKFSDGEREFEIDKDILKNVSKIKKIIPYTPLYTLFYVLEFVVPQK